MRESELAELLIRMASDRGVEIDAAAEELASFTLPSFVDARSFRAAVIQALERHLRAEVEERLQSIRRRFDADPQKQPIVPPRQTPQANIAPPSKPLISAEPAPRYVEQADLPDSTMAEIAPQAEPADNSVAEDELPTDATMVWTTRHG
jgi:hypothetical protein